MTKKYTASLVDNNPKEEPAEETLAGLDDNKIEQIEDALRRNDSDEVKAQITDLAVADAAELLEKVSEDDRLQLLNEHGTSLDPHIYAELDPEVRKSTFENMTPQEVANIVSSLESDDALDMVLNLNPDFQKNVIKNLSASTRVTLEEGLSFPEESAGRLMQREFVAIPQFWTVGKTIDYLRAAKDSMPEDFFDIFVINPTYHVAGEVPLSRLIRAKRSEKLADLTNEAAHPIPATMDQEIVAQIFRRENLVSAPVVDEDQRLIGVITIDDVVDVIDEETTEDFMKMAGVDQGDIYRAVLSTSNSRFRWLFINLLTAIMASVVISLFDAAIEQIVALAILMPIVASMGGNAGTQALTVAVRALAMNELSRTNAMRVIWKETLVGALNGIAFAIIMGLITSFWFHNVMLGAVIAAAMAINLLVAGLFGASIPIMLERTGSDPAVASTVLLTTVTDVIGFLSFLGLAAIFLI